MHTSYILDFLEQLQRNNSKTWMDGNREYYLEARGYFEQLVAQTLEELTTIDPSLRAVSPKECLFRINKNDFSKKDEAPYKGRMGAGMSRGGRHSLFANYILVLEPGNKSRIGGGIGHPSPQQLTKIREEIDYNTGELETILAEPQFVQTFGRLQGERLTGAPKGYSKSHPAIGLLQHKNFVALKYFSDEEVRHPSFSDNLLPYYKVVKPFLDFLNRAVEDI